jgi:cytochrome c peroxidase
MWYRSCIVISLIIATLSCADEVRSPSYDLGYSHDWPSQHISPDNVLTESRIALGQRLFYDTRLSIDSTMSCNSCHIQSLAFADSVAISPGIEGRLGLRNTPTLANLAFVEVAHRDGGVRSIDLQAMNPIEDHNEMAMPLPRLVERLSTDTELDAMAQAAYGRPIDNVSIVFSLASFVRSIVSYNSRYDRVAAGEASYTEAENRGKALFDQNCSSCHVPPLFGSNDFVNNGSQRDYSADRGRTRATMLDSDEGKFRVATLRNVALTAPYMHDGSYPTLASVIEQYSRGGSGHPLQDDRITAISLSTEDQSDLLAFLHTLTDSTLLEEVAYKAL